MAKSGKKRIETKKHLARKELERRQRRMLVIATAIVVGLVVLIVGYGIVESTLLQPRRAVATVNEDTITVRQYQSQVRYQRLQLVNQYLSTAQFAQSIEDEQTRAFFDNQLAQIQNQLNSFLLSQEVIDQMIDDRLIRQEAQERGIFVSEEEVDLRLKAELGYFPQGTPTSQPTLAPQMTSTLSPEQLSLITPTATSTTTIDIPEEPAETLTDTLTATATTTETAEIAPAPTSTPYTEDAFEENLQAALNNLNDIGIDEDFLKDTLEFELYRTQFLDIIAADVEPEEEQVWARHILVVTEEEAQDVLDRLIAGEDFGEVAAEVSQDPGSASQGGDLGWFSRNMMTPAFEEAAFSLEIGEISDPIETDFGYHIIQVIGHEVRPIDSAQYEQLREQALEEWLVQAREEADIEISDILQEVTPADPDIPTSV